MLVLLAICADSMTVNAQKKTRTRLKMDYEKLSNDDKRISVALIQGSGKKMSGVENAELTLATYDQDEEIELTRLLTDAEGEVMLLVEAGYQFPRDKDGYAVITATYSGNDSLKSANKQIKFMDLNVDIIFDIKDSIKFVMVSAYAIDSTGIKKPIEELKFNIGVERLYSILYLEQVETDDEGHGSMEFPTDLPGDSTGYVKVIVKLDGHDDYGTIIKSAETNWGTIVDYSTMTNNRSLFGDNAPLWMIISVAVILTGAWFHFILAIFKVYKMRKLA